MKRSIHKSIYISFAVILMLYILRKYERSSTVSTDRCIKQIKRLIYQNKIIIDVKNIRTAINFIVKILYSIYILFMSKIS